MIVVRNATPADAEAIDAVDASTTATLRKTYRPNNKALANAVIRRARPAEAEELSAIAVAAKQHRTRQSRRRAKRVLDRQHKQQYFANMAPTKRHVSASE